jgi:hypothetical protein
MAAPCLPLLAAELSCRLPAHPPAAGPSCQPRRLKQQAAGFVRPAPLFGAVRLPSMRYFERAGARPLDGFWAFSPRGVMGVSLSRLDGANAPGTRREPLHATAARPGVLHRLEAERASGYRSKASSAAPPSSTSSASSSMNGASGGTTRNPCSSCRFRIWAVSGGSSKKVA